jgi:hypothetical protein
VVGVHHLDGGHAHVSGRLEVDAQVVEEDGFGRLDAQLLTGQFVEARVGLAHADLRGFDDDVEQREHVTEPDATLGGHEVVGEQRRLAVLAAPPHRLHHLGPYLAGEEGEHVGGSHVVAGGPALVLEQPAELVEGHGVALQQGPGVGVRVAGVDLAEEPGRKAVGLFVVGERLERAGEDDAPEVPQHGPDGGAHGRPS